MIIWSGWGISVIFIVIVGMILGIWLVGPLTEQLHVAYGPAESAGIGVGGVISAVGISFLARWRETGGETRVFVDEATGQRFEVRPNAGSLFFIPTRYWTWIVLALAAFLAYSVYDSTGPTP